MCCIFVKQWPRRLMVRTLPFHGRNFGSTPCGATNGDCGVMVSTNDCGSFSQGSSPAVTQKNKCYGGIIDCFGFYFNFNTFG